MQAVDSKMADSQDTAYLECFFFVSSSDLFSVVETRQALAFSALQDRQLSTSVLPPTYEESSLHLKPAVTRETGRSFSKDKRLLTLLDARDPTHPSRPHPTISSGSRVLSCNKRTVENVITFLTVVRAPEYVADIGSRRNYHLRFFSLKIAYTICCVSRSFAIQPGISIGPATIFAR